MKIFDIIYFVIYLAISFALALYLFKKYDFFKKARGFLSVLALGIVSIFLHNLFYALFFHGTNKDEAFFFIISLLSLGASFFLLWLWLIKTVKLKGRIVLIIILLVILSLLIFFYLNKLLNLDFKNDEICRDSCGDGICQEYVCQATGCPCSETSNSCPVDCQ